MAKISPIKKVILKKLDFLPFIEYVPSVKPTPSAKPLLDELFIYESIVDDHVDFELIDEQNDDKKGLLRFQAFLKRKNRSDSIEEKLNYLYVVVFLLSSPLSLLFLLDLHLPKYFFFLP